MLIIAGLFTGKSGSNVILTGRVLLNYFFPKEIHILKLLKLELKEALEISQCNSNFAEEEPEAQSKYPFQDCTVRENAYITFQKQGQKHRLVSIPAKETNGALTECHFYYSSMIFV